MSNMISGILLQCVKTLGMLFVDLHPGPNHILPLCGPPVKAKAACSNVSQFAGNVQTGSRGQAGEHSCFVCLLLCVNARRLPLPAWFFLEKHKRFGRNKHSMTTINF